MVIHILKILQQMIFNLIINLESVRCHEHNLIAWVKNLNSLTLTARQGKYRVRLLTKLKFLNLLTVECLYGGTGWCKAEVHIFAILVRNVFIIQLKIYNGDFFQK